MRIVAVVPTYNEADNIGPLLDTLMRLRGALPGRLDVVVVDDHSPDGTAARVRTVQARHGGVHLLEAPRAGLGAAYGRGLRYALDTLTPDCVVQMDADLSHAPGDLPRLLAALGTADVVVGSRYLDGNRTPADWGCYRRLLSRGGNLVARHWLGLAVHDCTAGYRVWRADLLRRLEPDRLRVQGYAFQVALLARAAHSGARIVEVPVDFPERTHGHSKLGHRDLFEFAGWALRHRALAAR